MVYKKKKKTVRKKKEKKKIYIYIYKQTRRSSLHISGHASHPISHAATLPIHLHFRSWGICLAREFISGEFKVLMDSSLNY